ncbi:XRE family transcriptional regulator [Gemella haemolysans]|uniref:XRE family transcriptional regulator n=1 Tax=Gemella haemolysans TaxID=1379 RepID=UPI00232CBB8E|nr:XRE family transcriptional regulator [Gemella haemolysans]MDB6212551.1 XRE family transcriptional regulator [Gemella haemolysans]
MSEEFYREVKYKLELKKKTITWLSNMVGISVPYTIDILKGRRSPKERIEKIEYILRAEGII